MLGIGDRRNAFAGDRTLGRESTAIPETYPQAPPSPPDTMKDFSLEMGKSGILVMTRTQRLRNHQFHIPIRHQPCPRFRSTTTLVTRLRRSYH